MKDFMIKLAELVDIIEIYICMCASGLGMCLMVGLMCYAREKDRPDLVAIGFAMTILTFAAFLISAGELLSFA